MEARMQQLDGTVVQLNASHKRMGDQLSAVSGQLSAVTDSLAQNNSLTAQNNELMKWFADWLTNMRGFIRTLAWMGKTATFIGKWVVMPIVGAGVLIYMLTHNGQVPGFWKELTGFLRGD